MGIVLYLDSTCGLVRISGCAKRGHLIHTKLSFRPREVLWSESDFEYGKEAHYALTLFGHMTHRQSSKTFANVWKKIQQTAGDIHGDPINLLSNPILV